MNVKIQLVGISIDAAFTGMAERVFLIDNAFKYFV